MASYFNVTDIDIRILKALADRVEGVMLVPALAADIAQEVGVKYRTAVGRMQSLKRKGLVLHEKDIGDLPAIKGEWTITEAGRVAVGAIPLAPQDQQRWLSLAQAA